MNENINEYFDSKNVASFINPQVSISSQPIITVPSQTIMANDSANLIPVASTKAEPTLFASPVNIQGIGPVPGIFQAFPNGAVRLVSIGGDVSRFPYIQLKSNNQNFTVSTQPNNFNSQPTAFNTNITNSNQPPPLTPSINPQYASLYPTTSTIKIQDNQNINEGYQSKSIYPIQSIPNTYSNYAVPSNVNSSPVEVKLGNVVLRELPSYSKIDSNSLKSEEEIAFHAFCKQCRDMLKSSNHTLNESDILASCRIRWASMTKEEKMRFKMPMNFNCSVQGNSQGAITSLIYREADSSNPSLHDHAYIGTRSISASAPMPPLNKIEKNKCLNLNCKNMVTYSKQLGGFYCSDACTVVHSKKMYVNAFPGSKKIFALT